MSIGSISLPNSKIVTPELNIVTNDIFKECTFFGYLVECILQFLNYYVLLAHYFINTNKLNGNSILDLYSYLVLLKRKFTLKRPFVLNKINHDCLRNGSFNMTVSK